MQRKYLTNYLQRTNKLLLTNYYYLVIFYFIIHLVDSIAKKIFFSLIFNNQPFRGISFKSNDSLILKLLNLTI